MSRPPSDARTSTVRRTALAPSESQPATPKADPLEGADVEGVREAFGLARRRRLRLEQGVEVDLAGRLEMPHRERPVAIADERQPEAEGDDDEPDRAEDQLKPVLGARREDEVYA